MTVKLVARCTLALTLMAAALSSQADTAQHYNLNSLSSGYDAKTRFEYSQNDVIGFVYEWFSGFDHQREAGFFINRIATPVDMQYPDFPIKSQDDFLRWYKGVTDNIVWNTHHLKEIKVTGDQANGWHVSYDVFWDARDKNGTTYKLNVAQQMDLIRQGDSFKITKFRAQINE